MSTTDAVLISMTGHDRAALVALDRVPIHTKIAAIVDRWGVRGAAPRIGVDRRTLQRWREQGHQRRPSARSVPGIDRAYRASHLREPGLSDATIRLKVRDNQAGAGGAHRERTLDSRSLRIQSGTADRMVEAYIAGDYARTARELVAGIGDQFYRNWLSGAWRSGMSDNASERSRVRHDPATGLDYVPAPAGGGGGGTAGGGGHTPPPDEGDEFGPEEYPEAPDYPEYEEDMTDLAYEGEIDDGGDYGGSVTAVST